MSSLEIQNLQFPNHTLIIYYIKQISMEKIRHGIEVSIFVKFIKNKLNFLTVTQVILHRLETDTGLGLTSLI